MSNAVQKSDTLKELERIMPLPAHDIGTVRFALGSFQRAIANSLPPGSVSVPRMCSGLLNEIRKNPALLECTTVSLIGFVLQAAQFGLEIGSTLGQCYPVPYRNGKYKEAQFQIGYRGYLTLASRCPSIRSLTATAVYENDEIAIDQGTAKTVRHIPSLKERGAFIGVYGILDYTSGAREIHWMTLSQLEAFRARYVKAEKTPWDDPLAAIEMARKTVIRNLAKACAVSLEVVHAAGLDIIAEETEEPQNLAANVPANDEAEAVEDRRETLPTVPQRKGDKVNGQLFDDKSKVNPKDRAEN